MDELKLDNKWDAQVVAGILTAWAERGIANVGALRKLPFEEWAVSDEAIKKVLRRHVSPEQVLDEVAVEKRADAREMAAEAALRRLNLGSSIGSPQDGSQGAFKKNAKIRFLKKRETRLPHRT
jgi:hypothetical protein